MEEEYTEKEEIMEEQEPQEEPQEAPEEPVEEAAEEEAPAPAPLDLTPLIEELAERLAVLEGKMGDVSAMLIDAGATVTEAAPANEAEEAEEPYLLLEDMDFTI